ncbi:NAD(P)-binding oxidoreductase [Micromonospora sp. WMMD812]|uniref:NAD(P)-dependent oxidoreductase n=1 Tax=Micromonospora sp. WMMD812 TaxID=3015152 RepID=UPI00248B5751|nr:NAD(P)-binding oxidoreductase [Micromonospora sp. WMMD812]WBB69067.1 SDR family oxidoreductase [Micromonospora sp. WMMD812]
MSDARTPTAMPSHITIFGATGRTGRALLHAARQSGVRTTAHLRDPGRLGGAPTDRIVAGSVLDRVSVHDALSGAGAAVIAVGLGRNQQAPLFTAGTATIIEAMHMQRVRRLIVLSEAAYSPHTAGLVPRIAAAAYRAAAATAIRQRREQDTLLYASGLQWTIVRPVRVVDRAARGLRTHLSTPATSLLPTTYADLATLILSVLPDPATHHHNLYP